MLIPEIVIGGVNVSRFVMSIRIHQTTSQQGDPSKLDIELANTGQRFSEAGWQTQTVMTGVIHHYELDCSGVNGIRGLQDYKKIYLFTGVIQKVTHDSITKIEGTCDSSLLQNQINQNYDWAPGTAPSVAINKLLDGAGITNRVIRIPKDLPFDQQMKFEAGKGITYESALHQIVKNLNVYYWQDELGVFYLVDPQAVKGVEDLTGHILNANKTLSVVGHSNVVKTLGGAVFLPEEEGAEIITHRRIQGTGINATSLMRNGLLEAITIPLPSLNQIRAQQIAEDITDYLKSQENICHPIICGRAPVIGAYITYTVNFIIIPAGQCERGSLQTIPVTVLGLVKDREVEVSPRGLICECNIAIETPSGGYFQNQIPESLTPEQKAELLKSLNKDQLAQQKAIAEKAAEGTPANQGAAQMITAQPGGIMATDAAGVMILDHSTYADALNTAFEADRLATYDTIKNPDSIWKLMYNPETGQAYLTEKRNLETRDGYYQVLPYSDKAADSSSATSTMKAILENGWPDIEGI